ncbi:sorting nexin-2 [Patella vulgata]|uniref:sorting nexin-2 n=1 Tax=Patella vulgata TaxID=6465 RepID=UPI0024A83CF3|nr:sorting nexin-2 [Patella vulgata]
MADGTVPPPFEEEDQQKDDDDLFADSKEVPDQSNGQSNAEPSTNVDLNAESELEKDDDIFGGQGSEVALDSEEEVEEKKTVPSAPVAAAVATAPPAQPIIEAPNLLQAEKPLINVSQSSTSSSKGSSAAKNSHDEIEVEEEQDEYTIDIRVTDPHKVGDGMSAYIAYKVLTRTTIPAFRKAELMVVRRFSDFLGLHDRLAEKHVHLGVVVPAAPEKSVLGMTKVKMSKEESGSAEFIEKRRSALERYLCRTAQHPILKNDQDFREFLEKDELPRATSTSALSGAGMLRLFHKVGDAMEKITFKMDESDEWFEDKQIQVEALDTQLRKLHTSVEILAMHRKDLSQSTAVFAKSAAMLGNIEEHTGLSRALSQLAETEEKIEQLHKDQSDQDFFTMAELIKEYISLIASVKGVFHERVKSYKTWKEAEITLAKKRENKTKLELQHKTDKIQQAQQEIAEWAGKVETGQSDFNKISENVRKEVARFEKHRVVDFKNHVIQYLEALMDNQQKLIKYWEAFLPEAKAIV